MVASTLGLSGCKSNSVDQNAETTNINARCPGAFQHCVGDDKAACETNTALDVEHCGACGKACSTVHGTPACHDSMCSIACAPGFADCNGDVSDGCETDLNATNTSCGTCGHVCEGAFAKEECRAGKCVVTSCTAGYENCDDVADNGCESILASDTENCGSCKNKCVKTNATPTCSSGTCSFTCSTGFHACGDACVSNSSTTQCGDACVPCTAPTGGAPVCASGTCDFTCTGTLKRCGSECKNTATDVANCGTCGNVCATGASCTTGVCRCPGVKGLVCSGACVDANSDTNNCGTCATVCATGGSCTAGVCTCPGVKGLTCSGTCVDANTDAKNCGTCGTDCQGATCSGGTCQALVLATDVYYPKNLALTTNWLFFSDDNKNVWRVAKDGTSAPTIFATATMSIFKIMAAGNRVYWQAGTSWDVGRTVTTSLEDGTGKTTIMAGQTGWTTNGTNLFWQLPNATPCSCAKTGGGTTTCTPSVSTGCAFGATCTCNNDGRLMMGALDGTGATLLATGDAYDTIYPYSQYVAASSSAVYWRKEPPRGGCSGGTTLEIKRVPVTGGTPTSVLSWPGGGNDMRSVGRYLWLGANKTLTCGTYAFGWGRVLGTGGSSVEFPAGEAGILHDAQSDGVNDYLLVYKTSTDADSLYRLPTDVASPLPTPVLVATRISSFTVDSSFLYVADNNSGGKITRMLK